MKIKKMAGRIHPLMAVAAVSVTLVSLIGVAAITGLLPTSKATQGAQNAMATPQVQTALMAPSQPQINTSNQTSNARPAPSQQAAPVQQSQQRRERRAAEPVQQQAAAQTCFDCGRVESVQAVQNAAAPSGVGVGVGAVVGGLLGNQVGNGNGRTLATIAGAVGGGYAGNEVEKRTRTATTYQVRVRMEDGQMRSFSQSDANGWRAGDKVRVVNGQLTSRG